MNEPFMMEPDETPEPKPERDNHQFAPSSPNKAGQSVAAWMISLAFHAAILGVMAMVTWVVAHEPEGPIVLQLGSGGYGGGGGGGSPGNGGVSGGTGGRSASKDVTNVSGAAAMQSTPVPAPAPSINLGAIPAPAPATGQLGQNAQGMDLAMAAFGGASGAGGIGTGQGTGTGSGIGPGSGSGTGGGSGSGTGPGIGSGVGPGSGLAGVLDEMRLRGLDVVFVLDATDSMSPYIGQGKARLKQIVSVVTNLVGAGQPGSRANALRFGLVAFKDYGDDYGIEATKSMPLTQDVTKLQKALDGITAGGGGDVPEPLHEALKAAISRSMGWNRQRKSVIVLVTDAPCHSLGRDLAYKEEAAEFAKSLAGQVNVIDVGGVVDGKRIREAVLPDLQRIATEGGGSSFLLEDEQAFWRHMIVSIFGHRFDQDIQQIIDRYVKTKSE
jgi:Mg-chelatase subunit ChlD